jgi:outer membrane murein-binding lipoprotein Lpp
MEWVSLSVPCISGPMCSDAKCGILASMRWVLYRLYRTRDLWSQLNLAPRINGNRGVSPHPDTFQKMISGCKNLRIVCWRALIAFLPLLLVACKPEKTKPDPTAALETKIRELERNIEYLSSYTQSALEERDGKIQRLARGISDVEEKVKDLESDHRSTSGNSQDATKKLKELEMEISEMEMKISDVEMKVSRLRSDAMINSLR